MYTVGDGEETADIEGCIPNALIMFPMKFYLTKLMSYISNDSSNGVLYILDAASSFEKQKMSP